MKNKKISIIGTVGLPASYGGFETLVEYLSKDLNEKVDMTVYCSSKSYPDSPPSHNGVKLKYIPLNANGAQSIIYDISSMLMSFRSSEVLLILGVSGCIALPFFKKISKAKFIVNIDGLEWERDKWNKHVKRFLKYSEKLAVKYADTVITDNKVIQDYVKNEYGKDSTLIAYGADHVSKTDLSKELVDQYPFLSENYAFTVCRIEPENNLHIILDALSKQEKLETVIIGNWKASQYGTDLKSQYSKFKHIHLIDPIYDQVILNQIRSNCLIYLHGHSAGGTNPSLVEAMYLGLPIYCYNVEYNKETTEHAACYFSNSEELVTLISKTEKRNLNSLATKMKEIAVRRYRWEKISQEYYDLF